MLPSHSQSVTPCHNKQSLARPVSAVAQGCTGMVCCPWPTCRITRARSRHGEPPVEYLRGSMGMVQMQVFHKDSDMYCLQCDMYMKEDQKYMGTIPGRHQHAGRLPGMQALMQRGSLPSLAALGWPGRLHSSPCMAARLHAGDDRRRSAAQVQGRGPQRAGRIAHMGSVHGSVACRRWCMWAAAASCCWQVCWEWLAGSSSGQAPTLRTHHPLQALAVPVCLHGHSSLIPTFWACTQ